MYVDDILIMKNDIISINKIKDFLKSQFEIKDLGEAFYVLGMQIIRDQKSRTLYLSPE